MRELLRAYMSGKPLITLVEPEGLLGGLSTAQLREAVASAEAQLAQWGLDREVAEWGLGELPTAQQLGSALLDGHQPALEWSRQLDFQRATLRSIAERLLPEHLRNSVFVQGEIGQRQITLRAPRGARHHLFVSTHNAGAAALVEEVVAAREVVVSTTSDTARLAQCDAVLVYLTSKTWESAAFADEVYEAMTAGAKLLLVHESPGIQQEERHAAPFATFFDETPNRLLTQDIYGPIALT